MDIIILIIIIFVVVVVTTTTIIIHAIILVVFFDQCNCLHLANHSLQQLGAPTCLHSFLSPRTCNLQNIKSENMRI
jgi:hypothetical protein